MPPCPSSRSRVVFRTRVQSLVTLLVFSAGFGLAVQAGETAATSPAAVSSAAGSAAASTVPDPATLAKAIKIAQTLCAACHGADGNSVLAANPVLAGQHPEYLKTQLLAFKNNQRKNAVMVGQISVLGADADEATLGALAQYFSEQPPKPQTATNKAQAELGRKLYLGGDIVRGVPACMGCHGPGGAGIPSVYPRLAGQHAEYTVAQLNLFKANGERQNTVMYEIALKLTDEEIKGVAQYVSGLQ